MAGTIEAKLADKGITLPDAPAPAANYVPACRGWRAALCLGADRPGPRGRSRAGWASDMDVAAGAAAAQTCAISLLAQVRAACGGDLDRLKRVVKLTGFVNSAPDFTRPAQGGERRLGLPGRGAGRGRPACPLGRRRRRAAAGRRGRDRRHLRDRMTGRAHSPPPLALPAARRSPIARCTTRRRAGPRTRWPRSGPRSTPAMASRSTSSRRRTGWRWCSTTTRWTG